MDRHRVSMTEVEAGDSVIEMVPEEFSRLDDSLITASRRSARLFGKAQPQSDLRLTSFLSAPSKFRVATGVPLGKVWTGQGFFTEDCRMSGWALVVKPNLDARGKKQWRRRFLEVVEGELREFTTGLPQNFDFGDVSRQFSAKFVTLLPESLEDGDVRKTELEVLADAGTAPVLHFRATPRTVRCVVDDILVDCGEHDELLMNTILDLKSGSEKLLIHHQRTVSLLEKKLKRVFSLSELSLDTSEHKGERKHRLTVMNGAGETMIISVPEPLMLLQWVGAIGACDASPAQNLRGSSIADKVSHLVLQDSKKRNAANEPPRIGRTFTLGIGATLGYDPKAPLENEDRGTIEDLKEEMIAAPAFPDTVPAMKEMLRDPVLRLWVFKWSKISLSSENVKFYVACEKLLSLTKVDEQAAGLRQVAKEFVVSSAPDAVNISGLLRKRFLKAVEEAQTDDKMAALLPGILKEPMQEITRVMEFDLYPQLKLLFSEVAAERAEHHVSALSPSTLTKGAGDGKGAGNGAIRSVRDVLEREDLLQSLIFFCAGTKAQDDLLFCSMVAQYRKQPADTRNGFAGNIYSIYCSPISSHFLSSVLSPKRSQLLEKELAKSPTAVTVFDNIVTDAIAHLDATVLSPFLRELEAKKKASSSGNFGSSGQVESPTAAAGGWRFGIFPKKKASKPNTALATTSIPTSKKQGK